MCKQRMMDQFNKFTMVWKKSSYKSDTYKIQKGAHYKIKGE